MQSVNKGCQEFFFLFWLFYVSQMYLQRTLITSVIKKEKRICNNNQPISKK